MDDHKAGPQFSFELTGSFYKAFKKCEKLSLSFRTQMSKINCKLVDKICDFLYDHLDQGASPGGFSLKRISNMWKLP